MTTAVVLNDDQPWRNTWARHFQSVWAERARDAGYPSWQRVAFLAFGRHGANGHAPFAHGEIARTIPSVNKSTGEVRTNDNISRAIGLAVKRGWLAQGSGTRCLIVPPHAVQGGRASTFSRCAHHGSLKT
jgi:hypothetical protein